MYCSALATDSTRSAWRMVVMGDGGPELGRQFTQGPVDSPTTWGSDRAREGMSSHRMNFPLRRGIQGNLEMKEKIVTPLRMMSHALLTSALLMAGAAWAAGPQKGGVPGFLDPKTGAFTAYVAPTQHAQTLGVEAAT